MGHGLAIIGSSRAVLKGAQRYGVVDTIVGEEKVGFGMGIALARGT